MTTTKKLSWSDPRALRALADMQRQIAADMRDLACRMAMEVAAADTERRIGEAAGRELGDCLGQPPEEIKLERERSSSGSKSLAAD